MVTGNGLLLQPNEEVLDQSSFTKTRWRGDKNMLVETVPNEVIGIAVKVECDNEERCGKEVSELRHDAEENERNLRNCGATFVELAVVRERGSRIVMCPLFVHDFHGIHFTTSQTRPDLILKDLTGTWLGVELQSSTFSNEELREKSTEAVLFLSL